MMGNGGSRTDALGERRHTGTDYLPRVRPAVQAHLVARGRAARAAAHPVSPGPRRPGMPWDEGGYRPDGYGGLVLTVRKSVQWKRVKRCPRGETAAEPRSELARVYISGHVGEVEPAHGPAARTLLVQVIEHGQGRWRAPRAAGTLWPRAARQPLADALRIAGGQVAH
jgi:hypothetical protein